MKGNLPGTKTDGPVIQIYAKEGSGNFIKVGVADVNEETGNFSKVVILPEEGDYQIKARAVDLAGNKGGFSNVLKFAYVMSAPAFIVSPPDGAVRPFADKINVWFTLVSSNVGLDKTKTYVKLRKEGTDVPGDMKWINRSYLQFIPKDTLGIGDYEIEVNSVDNTSAHHRLNKISHFTIEDVPLITTNYEKSEFKTNHNPLRFTGKIDGRGVVIANAYINVTSLRKEDNLGNGEVSFPFDVNVNLREGMNHIVINALNVNGKMAVEPFYITLDTTPPKAPTFRFG